MIAKYGMSLGCQRQQSLYSLSKVHDGDFYTHITAIVSVNWGQNMAIIYDCFVSCCKYWEIALIFAQQWSKPCEYRELYYINFKIAVVTPIIVVSPCVVSPCCGLYLWGWPTFPRIEQWTLVQLHLPIHHRSTWSVLELPCYCYTQD